MHLPSRIDSLVLSFLDHYASDETYLKYMFYQRQGYRLNLKNPRSFSEKIQWIKLNDHNPLYTELADKYKVRFYIEKTIGKDYLIPLIGIYKTANDIDFDELPEQFVLKCNHGMGCNVICRNKAFLDFEKTKVQLDEWLQTDYSHYKREYHYKNISPLIVCEQYMKDNDSVELLDYKFFCIGGNVEMIQVDFDRYKNHKRNLYDVNWNLLNLRISFPNYTEKKIPKPEKLNEMIEIAKKLSDGFPQVRVDLFLINNKIYFGEMTFTSGAGFSRYFPRKQDFVLGDKLRLPGLEN